MMLRELDLAKLNSMTKYPSIPTYHTMGDKGLLTDEVITLPGTPMIATEKVDGTNSRIICLPDGTFVIGSREELLHARGDVIWNPALGIVDALRPAAERLVTTANGSFGDNVWVFYLEVFGGKVTANSKQYTGEHRVGYRLFDAVRLADYRNTFERSVEEISRWRDNGGQPYLAEAELQAGAETWGFELTPRIPIDGVPTGHGEVLEWLRRAIPKTRCGLDEKGLGTPEGAVVRTSDRSTIFKIRFEDYERHQRRSSKGVK
jgi:hypothetical protein